MSEVWYLDTSAFVKQLRREPETEALTLWLAKRQVASSDLLRTEARRVVLGEPREVRRRCDDLLAALPLIRLTPDLCDRAGRLEPRGLRSLDALHLVAAMELGRDLAGLVAYDRRLIDAASRLDLETAAPS